MSSNTYDEKKLKITLELLVNNLEVAAHSINLAYKLQEDIQKLVNIDCVQGSELLNNKNPT